MDSAGSKFIRTVIGRGRKKVKKRERERVVIRPLGFEFKGKEPVGERRPMEISSGGEKISSTLQWFLNLFIILSTMFNQ